MGDDRTVRAGDRRRERDRSRLRPHAEARRRQRDAFDIEGERMADELAEGDGLALQAGEVMQVGGGSNFG